MSDKEKELESRLNTLADAYPGFTWVTMYSLKRCGLVEAALEMLKSTPEAVADDVTTFECEYCGTIELFDEEGQRKPAGLERLTFTREMRGILADLKGRTFKSYECVPAEDRVGIRPDCMMSITLGQHAVYLFNRDFPFIVGGTRVEMTALRCERMSLCDDFGLPPDVPVHSYAVGERITGVELFTDHVEIEANGKVQELNIDSAVALRTAHAVYTFARESWRSTEICISIADDVVIPYSENECDVSWVFDSNKKGVSVKVDRTTIRLA